MALLAGVALACLGFIFLSLDATQGTVAQVKVDGAVVAELPLYGADANTSVEITAENGDSNTVTVADGRVCVSHANCPDGLCMNQGWISDGSLPIVCLPHHLTIEIIGGTGGDFDAATG